MDKIKAFFQKKKLDAKFKTLGQGQTVSSSSGVQRPAGSKQTVPQRQPISKSSAEAQKSAAEAALKRLEVSHKQQQVSRTSQSIKAQAKRELENEDREHVGDDGSVVGHHSYSQDVQSFEAAPVLAVSGVYFTCELLGDDIYLTKDDMCEAVEAFLQDSLAEDPMVASCLMIYSLNPVPTQRDACVEILRKYLENLIRAPTEDKYRKIRKSNRVFHEKVAGVKGAVEFLHSIGFAEVQEEGESFLVIPLELCVADRFELAQDCLNNSEPVPLKLYRNPVVLKPSAQPLADMGLPADFFSRTATEVKSEQQERTAELEKMLMLRTREMRERDEIKRSFKYKFCLLRIKFPDGYMLQGTFYSMEKIDAVQTFVRQNLECSDQLPFLLKDARGDAFKGVKMEKSLAELSLAPASVLHFEPDANFVRNYHESGQQLPSHYLKPELIEDATESV